MILYRGATEHDWPEIERLLLSCDLPVAGAREHLDRFLVAERDDAICGCIGAEVIEDAALLRSLAVDPATREAGVGGALAARLLERLRAARVRRVALLTTAAELFFERRGFARVSREDVPAGLRGSAEFNGACPASAIAMLRLL